MKVYFIDLLCHCQTLAAFAEAIILGQALGISQEMLLKALLGAAVTCTLFSDKERKTGNGRLRSGIPPTMDAERLTHGISCSSRSRCGNTSHKYFDTPHAVMRGETFTSFSRIS